MNRDFEDGQSDAVRNAQGLWINTKVFREPALYFEKYGTYCKDPWGSPDWMSYWREQRKRCIHGYEMAGAKITGDHYFYLNFCPIQKVKDPNARITEKINSFPDFWDGDYNYFWCRELSRVGALSLEADKKKQDTILSLPSAQQAIELKRLFDSLHLEVQIDVEYLDGGYNLIVGKSRRKGFSYKSGSITAKNYFTKPRSLTILNAYEKKFLYPKGLFTMAKDYIDFINTNTGWTMPAGEINQQSHIRASYLSEVNGAVSSKGFKSEIMALTCKDNPDANRGKDALDIFIEEAGAFGTPGLLKSLYKASEDCVKAGALKTGMMTVFGTSGDMEGGTADYADMFMKPRAFDMLPFYNIWDEGYEQTLCGFFHPVNLNMEGFYDTEGNSDTRKARSTELKEREVLMANGATSAEIQARMQEKPLGPSEAFAAVSLNNFPIVELKKRRHYVIANGIQELKGTPITLVQEQNKVVSKPILDNSRVPITSLTNLPKDQRGCIVMYEYPVTNAPKGLYRLGYDPVRQDSGTSLAAIVVTKGALSGSETQNNIVAEYIGRLETPDDIDNLAGLLAKFYNTKIMFENEVSSVKNYFRRRKELHLLAVQPDAVISKNIKNSKVNRIYGCHMTAQLKDAGERYVKEWLLTVLNYDENDKPITVIDQINSVRMLDELIGYHRSGNFDAVSALFMCMIQAQEELLGKEYDEDESKSKLSQAIELMNQLYR